MPPVRRGIAEDGILNVALRDLAKDLGDDTVLMADTCLDEFTDHGHCGVLDASGSVDNDATNARYVELAVAQAESGADVLGPSGMMDGQVAAIRDGLDGRRPYRHGDHGLTPPSSHRGFTAVPRGGRLQLAGRPAHVSARTRATPAEAVHEIRAGHRRGRRPRDGQTGDGLPRTWCGPPADISPVPVAGVSGLRASTR